MSLASTAPCPCLISIPAHSFPALQVTPWLFPFVFLCPKMCDGMVYPLNAAAVAGKHPRLTAYRPPGHPFVSGRRKRQWVPGSLCVKDLWNYCSNSLVLGNESGKWVRTYPGICFSYSDAFHGTQSNWCLAGGKQSFISVPVCCSLCGLPAGPGRWAKSCQLFGEGARGFLEGGRAGAVPSCFKGQIQCHTATCHLGVNFITNN